MNDFDEADVDGDGEFGALDISILEGEDGKDIKKPRDQGTGCCVVFMAIGAASSLVGYTFKFLIA